MTVEILERAGTGDHPITVRKAAGRVTLQAGGTVLVDTTEALILEEGHYPPVFYIPKSAVPDGLLQPAEKVTHCPYKGDATHWQARLADGRLIDPIVWSYEAPIAGMQSIKGYLGFYTRTLDADFGMTEV